tara:strand:- start:158 stop:1948 length:1791 start_codon:yes stop_codon:yes gene_type:complete
MESIEDLVNNARNNVILTYNKKEYSKLIDEFVLENQKIDEWVKLERKMRMFRKKHKVELRKMDLVCSYKNLKLENSNFYEIITKKAMRSQSGVLVVTVFTSANPSYTDKSGERKVQNFSCKHNCYYCPSEPAHEGNNWIAQPRSYLTKEPGVLRANAANYDCVTQVFMRVDQYIRMGHTPDKLEVLVLGGTWSEYPNEYQEEFVRDIYYAANIVLDKTRVERFPLETEILLNEKSSVRIIGLTLETRPDSINLFEIARFRSFGCTRIQMGVQHTNNRILKMSNRGHKIEDSINAIKLLKDNCYKVDIHLMPNLLGSNPNEDIKMFDKILYDSNLQVDQIKLYPVSVVPWSEYEKMHKSGKYSPYSDEELRNVLIYVKRRMHPWIRLNRVIRDIPIEYISGGCSKPNMRQSLSKISNCRCIRCREVKGRKIDKIYKKVRVYPASDGKELFISYESKDEKIIYGFIRLRIPKKNNLIFDELKDCALIRELHVYGSLSGVGSQSGSQHKGIGSRLLFDAEMAAFLNGFSNIVCISGIGVREFYRKRGYVITTQHGYLKKQMHRLAPFVWIIKLLWWISTSWRVFHLSPNQMRQRSFKIE